VRHTQKGLVFSMESTNAPLAMLGQLTPQQMLEDARKQGKTEQEINAFAASQPITPVAIKAGVLYVRDVFGRVFALRDIKPKTLEELRAKGTPFTPFANRRERRNAVRAEIAAKERKALETSKRKKARDVRRGPREPVQVLGSELRADIRALTERAALGPLPDRPRPDVDAELAKALDNAADKLDAELLNGLQRP